MIKNVIREDFYRLKFSKTLWICLAVVVGLALLTVASVYVIFELGEDIVDMPVDIASFVSAEIFSATAFFDLDISFFVMIIAAILVAKEFSGGSIRQVVACGARRIGVYISKWLKVYVVSFALLVAGALFSWVFGLAFFQSNAELAGFVARSVVIEAVALLGYTALYVFLAFLLRSTGGTIGVGIGVTVLVNVLTSFDQVIESGFAEVMVRLTMSGNLKLVLVEHPETTNVVFALVVPIIYAALFGTLGMLNFVKRDIK